MYVIAIIRYRKPLEELAEVTRTPTGPTPRACRQAGSSWPPARSSRASAAASCSASPMAPGAELLALRDQDPYVKGGVAQWELLPWNPVNGKENLDRA